MFAMSRANEVSLEPSNPGHGKSTFLTIGCAAAPKGPDQTLWRLGISRRSPRNSMYEDSASIGALATHVVNPNPFAPAASKTNVAAAPRHSWLAEGGACSADCVRKLTN